MGWDRESQLNTRRFFGRGLGGRKGRRTGREVSRRKKNIILEKVANTATADCWVQIKINKY